MSHTKEPWSIDRDERLGMAWNNHIVSEANPNLTICFMSHDSTPENEHGEANARRIVAAVNYCAGIESNVLEMSNLEHFKQEFSNLSRCETEKGLRILELEHIVESMRDSQIDKLLAMTDEQVTALCRLEGSNPDDSARIAKQAMQLAGANVRVAGLEQQRDELLGLLVEFSDALPSDKFMKQQGSEPGPLLKRIRAAIAGAKGGA